MVKLTPAAASAVKLGVLISLPYGAISEKPKSSARIKTMLGGGCVDAALASLESASDCAAAALTSADGNAIESSTQKRVKRFKRSTLSGKATRCDQ